MHMHLAAQNLQLYLEEPESPKQASYILQLIWRDLTSDYDIVGPYFTSSDSVDSQIILSCIMETVKLFQLHGLKTSLIVCDGSPANLATIKLILRIWLPIP